MIQRLPPSQWSRSDATDGANKPDETAENKQDDDLQTIFYSRGIAALELGMLKRRNGLDGSGSDVLASALADLKRATAIDPVRV